MEVLQNVFDPLSVIKEKIIKTDEVLQLLGDKSKDLHKLQKKYKKLLEKFCEKNFEIEQLKQQYQNVQDHLNQCISEQIPLKKNLTELKERYESLEVDHNEYVNTAENKYQTACLEVQELNKTCDNLTKKIERLEAKEKSPKNAKRIQNAVDSASEKLNESVKKYEEVVANNAKLISDLKEQCKNLEGKRNNELKQLAKFQLECDKLKKSLEYKNISPRSKPSKLELQKQIETLERDLLSSTNELEILKIAHENDILQLTKKFEAEKKILNEKLSALNLKLNSESLLIEKKKENQVSISTQTEFDDIYNLEDILTEMTSVPDLMSPLNPASVVKSDEECLVEDADIAFDVGESDVIPHFVNSCTQTDVYKNDTFVAPIRKSTGSLVKLKEHSQSGLFKIQNYSDESCEETEKTIKQKYSKYRVTKKYKNKAMNKVLKMVKNSKLNVQKLLEKYLSTSNPLLLVSPSIFKSNLNTPENTTTNNYGNITSSCHMGCINHFSRLENLCAQSCCHVVCNSGPTANCCNAQCMHNNHLSSNLHNSYVRKKSRKDRKSRRVQNDINSDSEIDENNVQNLKHLVRHYKKLAEVKKEKSAAGSRLSSNSRLNVNRFTDLKEEYRTAESDLSSNDETHRDRFELNADRANNSISRRRIIYSSDEDNDNRLTRSNHIITNKTNYRDSSMLENNTKIIKTKSNRSGLKKKIKKPNLSVDTSLVTDTSVKNMLDQYLESLPLISPIQRNKNKNKSKNMETSSLPDSGVETLSEKNAKSPISVNEECGESNELHLESITVGFDETEYVNESNNKNIKLTSPSEAIIEKTPASIPFNKSFEDSGIHATSFIDDEIVTGNLVLQDKLKVHKSSKKQSASDSEFETKLKQKVKGKKRSNSESEKYRTLNVKPDVLLYPIKSFEKQLDDKSQAKEEVELSRKRKRVSIEDMEYEEQKIALFGSESDTDSTSNTEPYKPEQRPVTRSMKKRVARKPKALKEETTVLPTPKIVKVENNDEYTKNKLIETLVKNRKAAVVKYQPAKPVTSGESEKPPCVFKKPEKNTIVPQSPMSPEPCRIECEAQEKQQPKLIPLEKPEKLETDIAKKLVEDIANMDWDKNLMTTVVNCFSNQEPEYVARFIVNEAAKDFSQEFDKTFTPPAPLMTITQQKLLILICRLENVNEDFRVWFLRLAEQRLLTDNRVEVVHPLTRLYVAVCKLKYDIELVRMMCCNAAYHMGDLFVPLMFIVLTMWGDVLPMASSADDIHLAIVLVQVLRLKSCKKPGYNLLNLNRLLTDYYGYSREQGDNDKIMDQLVIAFSESCSKLVYTAILILCKNLPSKWTYEQIKKHLMPLVDKNVNDVANCNLVSMTLFLVGRLTETFTNTEDNLYVKDVRNWMCEIVVNNVELSEDLKNVIKECSSNLTKIVTPKTSK